MLDERRRIFIRKVARTLSRLGGLLIGVALGLALWNGWDAWLLGYLTLGALAAVIGMALVPLYAQDLDDE